MLPVRQMRFTFLVMFSISGGNINLLCQRDSPVFLEQYHRLPIQAYRFIFSPAIMICGSVITLPGSVASFCTHDRFPLPLTAGNSILLMERVSVPRIQDLKYSLEYSGISL